MRVSVASGMVIQKDSKCHQTIKLSAGTKRGTSIIHKHYRTLMLFADSLFPHHYGLNGLLLSHKLLETFHLLYTTTEP